MIIHDTERSSRIVAEATRVIELTRQIDAVIENARTLISDRHAATIELCRLSEADLGGTSPSLEPAAIDAAIAIIAKAGKNGIAAKSLSAEVTKATGIEVPSVVLESSLRPYLLAGDVSLRADLYRPGQGRINRRQGKTSPDVPTDREMALQVLRESPIPLGVAAIISAVERRFGERIPRTTLSPLLAKLRDTGGLVIHADGKWLAEKY
ncbi:hypothetical protein [Sphingomonas sp. PP-CC-3G-468]|uniref:hypothetical protein n=1 Tax=Sphingomonas sp. PP-CC-3G-468 TaxID=2135656 RepID=UPI001047B186|nr:hypothetical protein [Sphingomonas sp. PP-CC-3G-468]TCM09703.1 hypothetical protein C8J41_101204 [Sphingomonas sp. PP-CC-3G-468]